MKIFAGLGMAFLLAMGQPVAPIPENEPEKPQGTLQERRWAEADIESRWMGRIDDAVDRYKRTKSRYKEVENMRPDPSVPSRVIFVLHGRESTWNFNKHLHEGSPLSGRTRWVPKGRPKRGSPPFTWKESAEDALYLLKDMENWEWDNLHDMLQNIEMYNGLGYQKYHPEVPSPYLWSGTDIYTRGKYVADGRFSKIAVDKQIGTVAILKRMKQRGVR